MARPITDAVLDAALAAPSDTALAVMRLSLLDWAACGIAGQGEPVARAVRALVEGEGGAPQASLIGGGKAPARAAALLNGAASHALDYDDTHFAHIGHPSVAVIPAALAMAEMSGASLTTMTHAALAGAEASVRFGLWLGRGHYQLGFHQTATAGAFGAAVAAGRVAGLNRAALAQALGLVSTRASGLKGQFGTMGKPYNAGIAAANGVEAVLLVQCGLLSNPGALDGQNGFFATHAGDGDAAQPSGWLMEKVSHKLHACCHGLHATLEALATLEVNPSGVASVEIATHPRWLSVCNLPAPETGLGAKFSYRTVTALALLGHDTAALETFSDALAVDPRVVALRERVSVVADDTLSEMMARVRVETGAGGAQAFHDLAAPVGTSETHRRLVRKAAALVGEARVEALSTAIGAEDLEGFVAGLVSRVA